MDCLMVFNHLNDLLYKKYNGKFESHIMELALSQGLIQKNPPDQEVLDDNVLIQIFSPIVSSHHIMHYQFGNSYSTVQFASNLKVLFSQFMGFLFISISEGETDHVMDTYVNIAKYLCGPDIYQLQTNPSINSLYTQLIDKWLTLRNKEQAICVEAIEQMIVNQEISSTCLKSLKETINKLSVHEECSKVHALLFVGMKFLSLYSSSNAKSLNPGDMLFLTILTQCVPENPGCLHSYKLCLSSCSNTENKSSPHSVHVIRLFEEVFLVYLIEEGDSTVSASLYETFHHLHRLRFIQVQREKESIKLGFDNLEIAVRRLNDSLRKSKLKSVVSVHKLLITKWDALRGKYKEYLKTSLDEAILRAETLTVGFLDNLNELYTLTNSDDSVLKCTAKHISDFVPKVTQDLIDFDDYFKVRLIKNFSLGSRDSLTVNKYLEEFPGLVHFLYVDRNTHRVTTPSLDMEADKAEFIQERVWSMVHFARSHLKHGHTTIIWKDKMFTYGYFLWFEDNSGDALKIPNVKNFSEKSPGILGEDYYTKLKTAFFPKTSPGKIRIYELYVMHLGLMPASAVLEQSRVLSSTVWELKGFPTHAIDLL